MKSRENLNDQEYSEIEGDFNIFKKYEGADQLLRDLQAQIGSNCAKVRQIRKGSNNGLFVLTLDDGRKMVAKFYQRDHRTRLLREYSANTFLSKQDFSVATPIIKNQKKNYGVYSYEEGESLNAADALSRDVDHLAVFLVRLQQFRPSEVPKSFDRAVAVMVNVQEVLDDNDRRISALQQAAADGTAHPLIRELLDVDSLTDSIHDLTQRILAGSADTSWHVAPDDMRLSPVDFGFHNALFRGDTPPVILDLEYFGWDDPLHPVADFIAHDQTLGLSPLLRQRFIDRYAYGVNLPDHERTRLDELIALTEVKWMAIYLLSLTPKYIQKRSFAAGGKFDEEKYIREQVKKIETRKSTITNQTT